MIKIKAVVTTILIILFIQLVVSGLVLTFSRSLGVEKHVWKEYHTLVGWLFAATGLVHFILNYKIYIGEVKAWKNT